MMAAAFPWNGALAADAPRPAADAAAIAAVDRDDIRRVLGGDPDYYAQIVGRHQRAIALYMWRFTRDPAICEELVQTVFVQAYLSLGRFRGDAPFHHWLKKIATHVGFHHWKKKKRERIWAPLLFESAHKRESRTASIEDCDLLYHLLAQLTPNDRFVLTMIYFEEMETAEIAELMGSSQTLVRVRAHRARARLRKLLDAHHKGGQP